MANINIHKHKTKNYEHPIIHITDISKLSNSKVVVLNVVENIIRLLDENKYSRIDSWTTLVHLSWEEYYRLQIWNILNQEFEEKWLKTKIWDNWVTHIGFKS